MAFFSVPARGDAGLQEDLNVFLRSHRVLTVHREFVGQGENAFWALAVEYLDGPLLSGGGVAARGGKERVDYKEVLAPADFALFAKLRDWRRLLCLVVCRSGRTQLLALLQFLSQPFVSGELLVSAPTGLRWLGGFARQLLRPVHLGLARDETNRNGYCGHWMLKLKAKGDIQCPKSSMW